MNQLKPMEGMTGSIKVDSQNNRLLVELLSPYPGNQQSWIYWLQDFSNDKLYEQSTIFGDYCNKWKTSYGMNLEHWLSDEIYSETAGVTEYQGEAALPWETQADYYKFNFSISIGTFKSKQSAYFSKATSQLAWLVDDNNIAAEIQSGMEPKSFAVTDLKI